MVHAFKRGWTPLVVEAYGTIIGLESDELRDGSTMEWMTKGKHVSSKQTCHAIYKWLVTGSRQWYRTLCERDCIPRKHNATINEGQNHELIVLNWLQLYVCNDAKPPLAIHEYEGQKGNGQYQFLRKRREENEIFHLSPFEELLFFMENDIRQEFGN